MERVRFIKHAGEREQPLNQADQFVNPFSYESSPEARVQLELEFRGVRFAYRYFAESGGATHTHKLLPDFAPEFTLPDYKVVIMVMGDFYGSLPGAIDRQALAQVLLHADGWKGVIWLQSEIVNIGVSALIHRDLPMLDAPKMTGPEIPSPYGHPMTMQTRKQYLRGIALLRKLFGPKAVEEAETDDGARKRRFVRRVGRDGSRYRVGGASHNKYDE